MITLISRKCLITSLIKISNPRTRGKDFEKFLNKSFVEFSIYIFDVCAYEMAWENNGKKNDKSIARVTLLPLIQFLILPLRKLETFVQRLENRELPSSLDS